MRTETDDTPIGAEGLFVVGAYVVFEDQAGDHEQDHDGGDGDEPGVEEGEGECAKGGAQGDAEGPVAAGAEETELAGAVGDVGVRIVLGTLLDPAGDELEVGADDQAQAAGERDADDPDDLLGPPRVDD